MVIPICHLPQLNHAGRTLEKPAIRSSAEEKPREKPSGMAIWAPQGI